MTELLPCPHCGEVPHTDTCFQTNQGGKWGMVACDCTEVRTKYQPVAEWRESAIAAWNKRATEPAKK